MAPPVDSIPSITHWHQRHRVSCEVEGTMYKGNYWVAGMILVVSTAKGGTSTQLAGRPPAVLAESLLMNLARDGKA